MIRGWCDKGDVYCDAGNVTGVHGTYFANYTGNATDWIVGNWNRSVAAAANSSESGSPTASGSGAPSSTSTPPPSTKSTAAGMLHPASGVLLAFLAVAGAVFGMLL